MTRIAILGSTGSIGENVLRVVASLPGRFDIAALAVRRNYERALAQAAAFDVPRLVVTDPAAARRCRERAPACVEVIDGAGGLTEVAADPGLDLLVCSVVGVAGLRPVLAAARRGTNVALATKEALVAAGKPVTDACAESGALLIPIDSEHSAIFQCLQGSVADAHVPGNVERGIRRLLLTASGGPFGSSREIDLNSVTVEQALAHPRWSMGRKITIDSATLMNKGLEILEAHWLFHVPLEQIDVLIHPESIVHSMVEFVDGSVLAQLSAPDMRYAIQYALTYPRRLDGGLPALDLDLLSALRFTAPEPARFPCLRLAREAGAAGGTMPAVLNAANEVAVSRFLAGQIRLPGIWEIVQAVMERHTPADAELDAILAADAWARKQAAAL